MTLAAVTIACALTIGAGQAPAADFVEVQPLSVPRDYHGAAVVGDRLYVVGGRTPFDFTSAVHSAPIRADGTLGAWVQNTPLPLKLINLQNSVVVANNTIYVCGGRIIEQLPGSPAQVRQWENPSVYYASVGGEGKASPWTRSVSWPQRNSVGLAAASDGRFLYICGGAETERVVHDSVFFAPFAAGGGLGPWTATESLPVPLTGHFAYTSGGYLYAVGGQTTLDPASTIGTMFRARITEGGDLEPWEPVQAPLLVPVSGAAGAAAGEFVFLFGGRTDAGVPVGTVQFTQMDSGRPTGWRTMGAIVPNRLTAAAAPDIARRAIYVTGGQTGEVADLLIDHVIRFPLPAVMPPPPFEGVATAAPTYQPTVQFSEFTAALSMAQKSDRYVFVFCLSPLSRESRQVWEQQLNQPQFLGSLPENVVPAYLDVKAHPEVADRLGINKVPAYAVFNAQGVPLVVSVDSLSPEQVLLLIKTYAK